MSKNPAETTGPANEHIPGSGHPEMFFRARFAGPRVVLNWVFDWGWEPQWTNAAMGGPHFSETPIELVFWPRWQWILYGHGPDFGT